MKMYALKFTGEGNPDEAGPEFVGFFAAENPMGLWHLVDEFMRPDEVQFTEIGIGGIVWWENGQPKLPLHYDEVEGSDDFAPHGPVSVTDSWCEFLFDRHKRRWRDLQKHCPYHGRDCGKIEPEMTAY